MIKIKSWFPKEMRDEYFKIILSKIEKKGTDTIEFLSGKIIDVQTLLIGTREEVFQVDGIKEYIDICNSNPDDPRIKNYKYDYINYDKIVAKWRDRLLSSLQIKCCPYCNRQYITFWHDEKDSSHSTADLDHYYQKKKYPLFALSLFNFVPSCQICNSRMKGSDDTETLYPYEEGMDEFHFRCEPKDTSADGMVDLWLANKSVDVNKLLELYELRLRDESGDDTAKTSEETAHINRIHGSIKVFHLEEVYKTHLEAAINEMLKIRIYLSGDYAESAKMTLAEIGISEGSDSKNSFSKDEMRDIILGFVYDGQNKLDQPLGKMLSDLLEYELKIKQTYDAS